jgi:uncharacterized protein DUF5684
MGRFGWRRSRCGIAAIRRDIREEVEMVIVMIAIVVLIIAGFWKMFEKAGAKGWMAIIPILNLYVLVKMAGKEGWWILLMLIPIVNFVVLFIVYIEIAHRFDRSTGFGVGMALLGVIFVPMIGFGDAAWTAEPVEI